MQILASTGCLPWWFPLRERFRLLRDAGVDGVELLLTPRLLRTDPLAIAAIAAEQGLPILSVHTTLRLRRPAPRVAEQDILESARFAAGLPECRVLVVHPPPVGASRASWLRALAHALDILGPSVTVGIENPERQRGSATAPFQSFEYLLRFAEEWQVGIVCDVSHVASHGWDLVATLRTSLARLVGVHLSDASDTDWRCGLLNALLRDHRLPGQGNLPLVSTLQLLRRARYSGFVTVEVSPLRLAALRRQETLERFAQVVDFIRSVIDPQSPQRSHRATGGYAPNT
ncbi:MAG: sugar phosphate isomerase/epimerase [Thermomicrobium sp.]|nr:sugar phosphate isomerase/epimerase [Thermomicrobium sp.]